MDYNNDGKKDLVVGDSSYTDLGRIRVYLNTGTDASPVLAAPFFVEAGGSIFQANNQAMPFVTDWDLDGDLDIICGQINGPVYLLKNDNGLADQTFSAATTIAALNPGFRSNPVHIDWDGDGKRDILSGEDQGRIFFYKNTGTDSNPTWATKAALQAGGVNIDIGGYSRIEVVDFNRDGILDILAGNEDGNIYFFQGLDPARPLLKYRKSILSDTSGNGNLTMDASETNQLFVVITNRHAVAANNVTATLSCTDPKITIHNPTVSYGSIPGNGSVLNNRNPFIISAASTLASGAVIPLKLEIRATEVLGSVFVNFSIGSYSEDPAAAYSWINTSSGTAMTFGGDTDEGIETVSLGFNFPFYGNSFGTAYVSPNGYISFTSSASEYQPTPLPSVSTPNNLVAVNWADWMGTGSSVFRRLAGGTAPNRHMTFEWNTVQHYNYIGSHSTFQCTLFEAGGIKFQYGADSGSPVNGGLSSIGIENSTGTIGSQHAYGVAGSTFNGKVVFYDPPGSITVDADGDGMADELEIFYFGNIDQNPHDDSDGDGATNLQELVAGTDPNCPLSVLKIAQESSPAAHLFSWSWQAIQGKSYNVQSTTNILEPSAWTNLYPSPIIMSANTISCYTADVSTATSPAYLRVTVK